MPLLATVPASGLASQNKSDSTHAFLVAAHDSWQHARQRRAHARGLVLGPRLQPLRRRRALRQRRAGASFSLPTRSARLLSPEGRCATERERASRQSKHEGLAMRDTAKFRAEIIEHLERALALSEHVSEPTVGYLI